MKMGGAGPPLEPHRRPQAGKSGYPRSQNADSRILEGSGLEETLPESLAGKGPRPYVGAAYASVYLHQQLQSFLPGMHFNFTPFGLFLYRTSSTN